MEDNTDSSFRKIYPQKYFPIANTSQTAINTSPFTIESLFSLLKDLLPEPETRNVIIIFNARWRTSSQNLRETYYPKNPSYNLLFTPITSASLSDTPAKTSPTSRPSCNVPSCNVPPATSPPATSPPATRGEAVSHHRTRGALVY